MQVIINRENFFTAMHILHWSDIHIYQAGSLWVTLHLSVPQIDTLKANNILYRCIH